jgi:hypothetical protein
VDWRGKFGAGNSPIALEPDAQPGRARRVK